MGPATLLLANLVGPARPANLCSSIDVRHRSKEGERASRLFSLHIKRIKFHIANTFFKWFFVWEQVARLRIGLQRELSVGIRFLDAHGRMYVQLPN